MKKRYKKKGKINNKVMFNMMIDRLYTLPKKNIKLEEKIDFVFEKVKDKLILDETLSKTENLKKYFEKLKQDIYNSETSSLSFYEKPVWIALKNKVLFMYKPICMSCGIDDVEMHVDHIFPRSTHKYLELNIHNLQVLCRKCNMTKSNRNTIDYRTKEQKELCQKKYT